MVNSCKRAICPSNFSTSVSETLERLGRGDFMHKMPVNVKQSVSLSGVDNVIVKDLVVKRTGHRGGGGHGDYSFLLATR